MIAMVVRGAIIFMNFGFLSFGIFTPLGVGIRSMGFLLIMVCNECIIDIMKLPAMLEFKEEADRCVINDSAM